MISRIAVREIETQLRDPLKTLGPSQHNRIEGFEGGPQLGPPLCRETPASRIADVILPPSGVLASI